MRLLVNWPAGSSAHLAGGCRRLGAAASAAASQPVEPAAAAGLAALPRFLGSLLPPLTLEASMRKPSAGRLG